MKKRKPSGIFKNQMCECGVSFCAYGCWQLDGKCLCRNCGRDITSQISAKNKGYETQIKNSHSSRTLPVLDTGKDELL